MKQPRREVVIDKSMLQALLNGAWAWSNYLRATGGHPDAMRDAETADLCLDLLAKSDDLLKTCIIFADSVGLQIPSIDDPMNFGDFDGK